jgi:hypothetical protein
MLELCLDLLRVLDLLGEGEDPLESAVARPIRR